MIYGITAFAGFEAAAALGEEARNARRSVPASMIGVVIVTPLAARAHSGISPELAVYRLCSSTSP
jgi:hypothetical protein